MAFAPPEQQSAALKIRRRSHPGMDGKTGRILRLAAVAGFTVFAANSAESAVVNQLNNSSEINIEYNNTDQDFSTFGRHLNNDTGTEYASGVTTLFDSAVHSLYNTARNQGKCNTIQDFISSENINVSLEVGGENIDLGWNATPNSDFSQISLTHSQVPGILGFDYEQWLPGTTPMTLRLNGHLDALKKFDDANPWDQAIDNYFVFDGQTIQDAFVATDSQGFPVPGAEAQAYNVVPEPATVGLLLLGGLAAIGSRRLMNPLQLYKSQPV